MKNYKIKVPNIEINTENISDSKFLGTFKEVDTNIPKVIVDKIQNSLNSLDDNLQVRPIMIDPNNLNIVFDILESNKNGVTLKYNVTISKQKI
jgi:translation initiation factor 6 (eIF-6)